MFSKLRKQLLAMNLIMISFVMMAAFITIYWMTAANIQEDIQSELYRISDFRKNEDRHDLNNEDRAVPPLDEGETQTPPPDRFVSFTLYTDVNHQLIEAHSFFDSDSDFYQEALQLAFEDGKKSGQFVCDNSDWAYNLKSTSNGYVYTFLDVSSRQAVLDRLIYTFIIVSLITFVFIVVISRIMTKRSIQPVKDAFNKQKQFISDASHELKTPLAVIHTNVDVLLSNHQDQPSQDDQWLHYIKKEVVKMSQLTNDLLYLAQMEKAERRQQVYDLSERVEHQMLGLEAVAYEKEIQLSYQISPHVMHEGIAEEIEQVLMILMDNALKYTPRGGKVTLSLEEKNHHPLIEVTNTGAPISPEDCHRLFDRFYRVDASRHRNSQSYGLGLSIAKAIVEGHHGKISVHSDEANTRFTVKL